ncbi:RDD family protein [Flavobacterium sp.]|uniref:RDD family protein n=1 Tax=Flavobacterium sp. TaxID=239 RepID=UPI0039E4A4B1
MKKITELTETRLRTVYNTDAYGNRERDAEEWIFTRQVKTIESPKRFLHYVVDNFIIQSVFFGIESVGEIIAGKIGLFMLGFINLPSFLVLYIGYYAITELLFQRSPGKFLTKTVVIDEYGNKPELGILLLRNALRVVPFEALSCLGDKYSYGWHDKWSKTWVVTESERDELKRLQLENENEIEA